MGSAMALKLILLGALCFTATAEDSLDACLQHLSDPEASPDSQNCIFDSNAILSIFSNADNLECNLCNEISDLTYDTTVLLNPHITKPTAELVSLQCVKAYVLRLNEKYKQNLIMNILTIYFAAIQQRCLN